MREVFEFLRRIVTLITAGALSVAAVAHGSYLGGALLIVAGLTIGLWRRPHPPR